MKKSFGYYLLAMENDNGPLLDSGDDTKSTELVRSGLQLDEKLWDHFISLCADTEAMAELFGVSPDEVLSWPDKIKKQLEKADDSEEGKDRNQFANTGNSNGY